MPDDAGFTVGLPGPCPVTGGPVCQCGVREGEEERQAAARVFEADDDGAAADATFTYSAATQTSTTGNDGFVLSAGRTDSLEFVGGDDVVKGFELGRDVLQLSLGTGPLGLPNGDVTISTVAEFTALIDVLSETNTSGFKLEAFICNHEDEAEAPDLVLVLRQEDGSDPQSIKLIGLASEIGQAALQDVGATIVEYDESAHADHAVDTSSDSDHSHAGDNMVINDNNAYLMAMGEGSRIEIHSADRDKTSWTHLETKANKGATSITVQDATGWQAGDTIAISSTSSEWYHSEERVITKVEGNKVYFDQALKYSSHQAHTVKENNGQGGEDRREWEYDVRAEVANLSRNVTIQGDEDSVGDGFGGHTMVMDGATQHIDGAEFFRMGQKDILGRYPIHWHEQKGDGEGQYVENSAVHHSYQKGITIHSTNKVTVEDNVIFDHVGHGLFLEDGDETNNNIIGNLVFNTRESKTGKPIRTDKEHASSFWIENPNNTIIDNVAAGGQSNGFWIMTTGGHLSNLVFKGNTAHSYKGQTGSGGQDKALGIGGRVKGNTDFGQKTLSANFGVVEDFTLYKGAAWLNTHELVIKDSIFANVTRLFSRHENYFENTLFDSGNVLLYRDGGQQFHDVHFDKGTKITVVGSDHVNTQDAFENVTVEGRAFPIMNWRAGRGDQHVIADIDGSISPGKNTTHFIVHHSSDGIFKSAPGAQKVNNLGWVTDATLGVTEVTASNFGNLAVLRSDGAKSNSIAGSTDKRVAGDDNGDASGASREFNTATGQERDNVWLLDFQKAPKQIKLNLTGVREGESAIYEIPGAASSSTIKTNEVKVNSFKELLNSEKSAYFQDLESGSLFIRLVADKVEVQGNRPVEDLLADFRAREDVTIQLSGLNDGIAHKGHTQVNQKLLDAIAAQPARETVAQAETQAPQKELKKAGFELVEYETGSDTTELSDAMPRWSSSATWDDGVPGADDIVVIGPGKTVVLDTSTVVKGIIVNGGELIVEDDANLKIDLSTDYLLVINGGLFQAGTEQDPIDTDFTLTLEGDDKKFDLEVSKILNGEYDNTVSAIGDETVVNIPDPEVISVGPNPIEETPEEVDETPDEVEETPDEGGETRDEAEERPEDVELTPPETPATEEWPFTLRLIDAKTDKVLGELTDGQSIKAEDLNLDNFAIQLVPDGSIGSVRFKFDGETQVESYVPYALFGDGKRGKDIWGESISPGEKTVSIEVFSKKFAKGKKLFDEEITFTIEEPEVEAADPVETLLPSRETVLEELDRADESNEEAEVTIVDTSATEQAPADLPVEIGLYNADSDALISLIEDGDSFNFDRSDLPNLAIAVTVPGESALAGQVESVVLDLNNGAQTKTESVDLYALYGNNGADIYDGDGLSAGENNLTLSLFDKDGAKGNLLETISVDFTINEDLLMI